jgi:hypothetical protein
MSFRSEKSANSRNDPPLRRRRDIEVCMKRLVALSAVAFLAACGADGEPQAPTQSSPGPGVTISGDARIGVVSN